MIVKTTMNRFITMTYISTLPWETPVGSMAIPALFEIWTSMEIGPLPCHQQVADGLPCICPVEINPASISSGTLKMEKNLAYRNSHVDYIAVISLSVGSYWINDLPLRPITINFQFYISYLP